MEYICVDTFGQAVNLFVEKFHASRKDIESILADGKETVFRKNGKQELLFIPDKMGFICAVKC